MSQHSNPFQVARVSVCVWKNTSRDGFSIRVNIHYASRLIHSGRLARRIGLIRVNGLNPPLQKMWGMFPFPVGRGLSEWEGFVCLSVEVQIGTGWHFLNVFTVCVQCSLDSKPFLCLPLVYFLTLLNMYQIQFGICLTRFTLKREYLRLWQWVCLNVQYCVIINFWYVLAYLKDIQDVGVFVSTVFSILIF